MSRIQALLTAGALTGLVIMAIFWYGTGDAATAVTSTVTAAPVTTLPANITAAGETTTPDMQLLLEQNQQLRETVTTLLNREEAYRQQIEAANQQMLATQEQLATDLSTTDRLFQGEDDDEDEHEDENEEHEREEHEREKHEEHEHEGHDDDD